MIIFNLRLLTLNSIWFTKIIPSSKGHNNTILPFHGFGDILFDNTAALSKGNVRGQLSGKAAGISNEGSYIQTWRIFKNEEVLH